MSSRLPLEELAALPNSYFPQATWSGDRVGLNGDKSGRLEPYVLDIRTRAVTPLSHGELPRAVRAAFRWDRRDETIIFVKDHDGNEQHDLYAIDVRTGKASQLTNNPGYQEYPIQLSPDNEWLTALTNTVGQLNLRKMRRDRYEYTRLTHYPNPVFAGVWGPDGQWIAYGTNESGSLKNIDSYVLRADSSKTGRVFHVPDGLQDRFADWAPDGRSMAVKSDASVVHRSSIRDWQSGAVRWLGEDGVDEIAVRFTYDGKWLTCIRHQDSQLRPVLYDVASGALHDLKLAPGIAVGSHFVLNDSALLTTLTTDTTRPSLVLCHLDRDSAETLIAREYGRIDPGVFVPCEHIRYDSFDGLSIPALLYRPRDVAPGAKLRALVLMQGGPHRPVVPRLRPVRAVPGGRSLRRDRTQCARQHRLRREVSGHGAPRLGLRRPGRCRVCRPIPESAAVC